MKKSISAITAVLILTFFTGMVYAQSSDVIIYGTTMPLKKVTISTKVPGTLDFVPEIEGTKVKSGEVIIILNKKDFELTVDVLKNQVKLSEISSSHASVESKRMTDLFSRNATSAQSKDNAVFAKDTAYASLELTKSNLKIAEKAVEDTIIRAPFDGIVSKKILEAGEYVDKGKPVVEIVNIDTIKALFKVPEKFVTKVKIGDKIKISLEHCPENTFTGEVYSINPMGDSVNHSFEIIVNIKNTDHAIKAGMFVKGILTLNLTEKSDPKAISQNINENQKKANN